MTIFCCRCRRKVTALAVRRRTTANGQPQAVGRCPDCGGRVYRFLRRESEPMRVVHPAPWRTR